MKRIWEFAKQRKWALLISVALLALILYFFIPRRLSTLCLNSDALSSLSVCRLPDGGGKDIKTYTFTQADEVAAFKELLASSYARPKAFHVAYVNGGYEGYDFSFYENEVYNQKRVFLFTSEVITINGRQFVLYRKDFSAKLKELLSP